MPTALAKIGALPASPPPAGAAAPNLWALPLLAERSLSDLPVGMLVLLIGGLAVLIGVGVWVAMVVRKMTKPPDPTKPGEADMSLAGLRRLRDEKVLTPDEYDRIKRVVAEREHRRLTAENKKDKPRAG